MPQYVSVTIRLYRPVGSKQLYGHNNQPNHPQHEEYKGIDHDNCWEKAPIEDEPKQTADVQNGYRRNSYEVREVPSFIVSVQLVDEDDNSILPRYPKLHLFLDINEVAEYANN